MPDNVSEILRSGTTSTYSTVTNVLNRYGSRSFRGALLLTLAISPLTMLTTRDLLKDSLCEEQILLVPRPFLSFEGAILLTGLVREELRQPEAGSASNLRGLVVEGSFCSSRRAKNHSRGVPSD